MHKTLQRQIIKYLGSLDIVSKDPKLVNLFNIISLTYQNYDEDKKLIEHSLELSSKELNEKNKILQEQLKNVESQKTNLERLNKFMVDRELKMIDLKKEIERFKTQQPTPQVSPPKTPDTNQQQDTNPSQQPHTSIVPNKIDGITVA